LRGLITASRTKLKRIVEFELYMYESQSPLDRLSAQSFQRSLEATFYQCASSTGLRRIIAAYSAYILKVPHRTISGFDENERISVLSVAFALGACSTSELAISHVEVLASPAQKIRFGFNHEGTK
jgi:hypothetical protein